MTQAAIKKLASLRAATAKYSPRVARKLAHAGRKPNSAVVESAAKYYVALKKLAEEK